MTSKFRWMDAFSVSSHARRPTTYEQRELVVQAIYEWNSEWNVDTDNNYICHLEDEDGDTLYDEGWDDEIDVRNCFSRRFVEYMDKEFLTIKKKVVVGNATKLPLPGDSPLSSSKGVAPSSSF